MRQLPFFLSFLSIWTRGVKLIQEIDKPYSWRQSRWQIGCGRSRQTRPRATVLTDFLNGLNSDKTMGSLSPAQASRVPRFTCTHLWVYEAHTSYKKGKEGDREPGPNLESPVQSTRIPIIDTGNVSTATKIGNTIPRQTVDLHIFPTTLNIVHAELKLPTQRKVVVFYGCLQNLVNKKAT